MTRKPVKSDSAKTYVMGTKAGRLRRITVPASWKVTFGPLVPGAAANIHDRGNDRGLSLRFYEAKDQQRAVFTDVMWFRDQSLKVEERITKTKQKVVEKNAPGGHKGMVVEARITEWRDPEAPDDGSADAEFLAITDQADENF